MRYPSLSYRHRLCHDGMNCISLAMEHINRIACISQTLTESDPNLAPQKVAVLDCSSMLIALYYKLSVERTSSTKASWDCHAMVGPHVVVPLSN